MKYLVMIVLLAFSACSTTGNETANKGVVIKGEIQNPQADYVRLLILTSEGLEQIDSVMTSATDGGFSLNLSLDEPAFLRLNVYDRQMINLILTGNEKEISVKADGSKATGMFSVSGSRDTDLMMGLDSIAKKRQSDVQLINNEAMQANSRGDMAELQAIREQYFYLLEKHKKSFKNKIWSAMPSLASMYGLNYMNLEEDFTFMDSVVERYKEILPEHPFTIQFGEQISNMRKLAIGSPAPEIALNDPDGNLVSLSSLQGKYVLIDFWAAWCRPCRQENPNVVRLYQKYGGENFEILGVSLDRTREAWVKAIADDRLTWKHVSDLQYFNSEAAREYQIGAIPATYLIDPDGKIVAKNLRAETLEAKLKEIFGK